MKRAETSINQGVMHEGPNLAPQVFHLPPQMLQVCFIKTHNAVNTCLRNLSCEPVMQAVFRIRIRLIRIRIQIQPKSQYGSGSRIQALSSL